MIRKAADVVNNDVNEFHTSDINSNLFDLKVEN